MVLDSEGNATVWESQDGGCDGTPLFHSQLRGHGIHLAVVASRYNHIIDYNSTHALYRGVNGRDSIRKGRQGPDHDICFWWETS